MVNLTRSIMSCCGGPKTGKEFDFDEEGPSEEDLCKFGSDIKRCASCRTEMYHSATICPACGHAEESVRASGKRWVLITALVAFVAMLAWLGIPLI
ncbi:MAG: hypothetical protein R3B46_02325 [Phycisphaerales bacterium]